MQYHQSSSDAMRMEKIADGGVVRNFWIATPLVIAFGQNQDVVKQKALVVVKLVGHLAVKAAATGIHPRAEIGNNKGLTTNV